MSIFDIENIEVRVTTKDLLTWYTEEQIFKFYFPEFEYGTIHSPFRIDNHPSFRIYETKMAMQYDIYWNDQKTGESGSVFDFVKRTLEMRQGRSNIHMAEVLRTIYKDMIGITRSPQEAIVKVNADGPTQSKKEVKPPIIQAILHPTGDIPEWAYQYWKNLGYTRSLLRLYHVNYAEQIWIIKYKNGERKAYLWGESTPDNPIFFYYFPQTQHIKAYRPLEKDKKLKWISNVANLTDIQGLEQCFLEYRNPELLVLTKSMKDIMWLRTIGVDAIALHGERHTYTPAQITYLRSKCKRIISIYDNDFAGMRGAIRLRREYGIPDFYIPGYTGVKDITDLYQKDYHMLQQLTYNLKDYIDANYYRHTQELIIAA